MKVQQARCQEAPTIPPLMEDQTLLTSERSACAEIILASHSQEVRNATSSEIFSAALPSAPSHHSLPVLVLYHPKLTILYTLDIRLLAMLFEPQKQLHWSLILFGLQCHICPSFSRLMHSFLAQTTTFS